MKENYSIKIQCLFCKSEQFELPEENYQPSYGEMIKCANCGKLNDCESMCNVAKEKGIDMVKEEVEKTIKNTFKDFKV